MVNHNKRLNYFIEDMNYEFFLSRYANLADYIMSLGSEWTSDKQWVAIQEKYIQIW